MKKTLLDKDELTKSIATLEQEVEQLKSELEYKTFLYERRNRIGELPTGIRTAKNDYKQYRIGIYDYEMISSLPDFETKWKHSYFVTHQEEVELVASCSLKPEEIERRLRGFQLQLEPNQTGPVAFGKLLLALEAVLPTPEGYSLVLSDPFQTIHTQPVCDEKTINSAMDSIGQMVFVRLHFYCDGRNPRCRTFEPFSAQAFD